MRLGQIIDKLEQMPEHLPVCYDTIGDVEGIGNNPGQFDSYRGYYHRLALEPDGSRTIVRDFLKQCKYVDGTTFEGYKGGDFIMGRDTIVHVAHYGECTHHRIVAIEVRDVGASAREDYVALVVADVEDF